VHILETLPPSLGFENRHACISTVFGDGRLFAYCGFAGERRGSARILERRLDLAYLPMQEPLEYLRVNGFKTFIVSGGSVEFMRPWAQQSYGVPPEQVVGSQQEVNSRCAETYLC
jgi:hypothetical protein